MKILKKLVCAAPLALSVAGGANAGVVNEWVFNPVGTGFENSQLVNEYLDVNGSDFIQTVHTGGSSFTFRQHSVFNILQADSNGQLFPINFVGGNITGTIEASGTGSFNGATSYTGGTVRIYQNPTGGQYGGTAGIYGANLGKEIAAFDVIAGGGGMVDAGGVPLESGEVTLFAKVGKNPLDAAYFFSGDGGQLSTNAIMAFSFTNPAIQWPAPRLVDEVACQFAGFTGAGCSGGAFANTPASFFVSQNGVLKLVDVPEPGSVALFGIAMLGVGVVRRARAGKAA